MASSRYAVRRSPRSPRSPTQPTQHDTTAVYAAKQQHSPHDLTTLVLLVHDRPSSMHVAVVL